MKNYFVLLFLLIFANLFPVFGQKTTEKKEVQVPAVEKHYEYLENESKVAREHFENENKSFREFIQNERTGHQDFLENCYTKALRLLGIAGFILAFFGWNTFKGIQDTRKEIEAVATKQLLDYGKALQDSENRLQNAQQNMRDLEKSYQEHINFYREANPKNGRYLFIGTAEKLEQMTQNELIRFVQVFGMTEKLSSEDFENGKFFPVGYDVVVYRSDTNGSGEDAVLIKLVEAMKAYPMIPIIVYASNKSEWLNGTTQDIFNKRPLNHLANYLISLIDNVASAYRVSKLLGKANV